MDNKQSMTGIKSKERVQQHGEVFTPDSIVNDMLDLVEKEITKDDIDKYLKITYLEPSCGNGNFLIRILDRKMCEVQKLPKETWVRNMLVALSSIYGIDIQLDNVNQSKERIINLLKDGEVPLLEIEGKEIKKWNFTAMGDMITPEVEENIRFILDENIMHGNALTGLKGTLEQAEIKAEDLIVTEYTWDGDKVKLSKIAFNSIVNGTSSVIEESIKDYKELKSNKIKQGTRNRNRVKKQEEALLF